MTESRSQEVQSMFAASEYNHGRKIKVQSLEALEKQNYMRVTLEHREESDYRQL